MPAESHSDSELLICLGAQKAGTTSLHAWLGSLPQVSTASSGKEIDYFSRYFDFGTGWYLDHFSSTKPVWLDVSPNYFIVPDLAERLRSLPVPYRCVLLVRDPAERARSQHRHSLVTRPDTTALSFTSELARNPTYLTNGYYGRVLAGLEPLLADGRLRIVWFEDLVADPASVVESICTEMGIGSRPSEALLERRSNASGYVRSSAVQTITHASGTLLRRAGGERAVSYFRASRTIDRILSANRREIGGAAGDDGFDMDMGSLRAMFRDDLQLAERISGLPFLERYAGGSSPSAEPPGGETA
jgi:hypothetical protein